MGRRGRRRKNNPYKRKPIEEVKVVPKVPEEEIKYKKHELTAEEKKILYSGPKNIQIFTMVGFSKGEKRNEKNKDTGKTNNRNKIP